MTRIHVISGFLGAGKTTLIKKLIASIEGTKVIIENEFGEAGIDGEILQSEDYDVIELAQGCICCSLKADFKSTVRRVIDEYKPEHIIIEPTGIGNLSDIMDALSDDAISESCIMTLPVTVVDSLDYLQQVEEFGGFFRDQISNAGIIVLSKTQLMGLDNLHEIIGSLRGINSHAEIIADDWAEFSEIEYDMLTNTTSGPDCKIEFIEGMRDLANSFQSFSVARPKKFDVESLEEMLKSLSDRENGRVIRAKGFVQGEDGGLEFSYANGKYSIGRNSLYNSRRICVIGSSLNRLVLTRLLADRVAVPVRK